ncbi:hypothetical protein B0H16DRAFT_1474418 [Mycena metata]|uniref:Uncharacterized protein n=1 Tax=Mycena metata TaxID=1033252 RepID=A0AAD7HH55_9AGAR|nr:hypothetical protein B0H16DRAFT_1474418 [Mycena metata]
MVGASGIPFSNSGCIRVAGGCIQSNRVHPEVTLQLFDPWVHPVHFTVLLGASAGKLSGPWVHPVHFMVLLGASTAISDIQGTLYAYVVHSTSHGSLIMGAPM